MTTRTAWQPIMAVLANEDARDVACIGMQGGDIAAALDRHSPSRRRRIEQALRGAGMLDEDLRFDAGVFARALGGASRPRRVGVERFLEDGRIRQYPADKGERGELLRWVARRAFRPDEALTEREVGERLSRYHDDHVVLRRYLVDYGLLDRAPDGGEYRPRA